ncbi:NAD-dependent epimerase/dehydratase family protein [Planosporangium flavigriseum]|uniref:UDP-glucose 4-epimerase-like protein n=1 Tax=Planosporangium flavigriseum TaxID=373681 RepID=A0A8J3PNN9_9ACTN|nr:NAD-dependent epimerase/dehydratase family protein [Planosporangium flavigriseum]NJC67506.1 NAD-dependent epimerase/dehydratase family protein [Planosporangium flavigriseum]GIG75544.1 UDP-glucose 4-epimerase-like protein [Planosporangium flavigriseum]
MKVVVTGGAGFIGANLCRELVARPEVSRVVALDNLSTGSSDNLAGVPVELVEGSILDRPLLSEVVAGADAVVHLAARPSVPRSIADPVASHEANATGTLYVLEACRQVGAYAVVASSSSVYGSVAELPKHEDLATRPLSPYAATKLITEGYALAYASAFSLPTLALRFFNVYGPLQAAGHAYAAVVPAFVDAALRGEPLQVHGDGRQTRDFTYVGTVARVLADAVIGRVRSDAPVNLAFGTRTSLLELIDRLSALLGRPLEVEHVAARSGDVRDSQAANERLRTLFPQIKAEPLEYGLERTVEWFRGLPGYESDLARATSA